MSLLKRIEFYGFLWWLRGKESNCNAGDARGWFQSLDQEDPLKGKMTTHSSSLAWKIPWTVEPDGYSPWAHKVSDTTE